MGQHQFQTVAGKELESLKPGAATGEQQREQLQRLLGRRHRGQHHGAGIGARQQAQRGSRDHAQRAFRANQQLLEVVAGVVLAQRAQAVEDLAIGQHRLHAQHQLARHAVAHHVHAAGVGGEVAADLARVLGRQREREQPVGLLGGTAQVAENAAGLHDHGVGDGVDRADLVHAVQAQDHVDGPAVRRGTAAQAGIAAARHHRHAGLLAQRQRPGDLLGRARPDHGLRLALVEAAPVAGPRRHVIGRGGHHVGAKGVGQALQEGGVGHGIPIYI
ncbi:hypothetical protein D3C81_1293180 [compost metagenome]